MTASRALGRAGAKAILLGEHAVVYGKPALVVGLGQGASCVVERTEGSGLKCAFWGQGQQRPRDATELELDAVQSVLGALGVEGALRIEIQLEVPEGVGLGASAAAGVALARALSQLESQPPSSERVLFAAQCWESVFHGNASGVDAAAALHGGLLRFVRGTAPVRLQVPQPFHLLVAVAAPPASTRRMVEIVARLRSQEVGSFDACLDQIAGLVADAERALMAGDGERAGQCMSQNQALLARLGVSTPELEQACAWALEAGAWGAKLTGAGGGGCVVALAPASRVSMVREALVSRGLPVFRAALPAAGES